MFSWDFELPAENGVDCPTTVGIGFFCAAGTEVLRTSCCNSGAVLLAARTCEKTPVTVAIAAITALSTVARAINHSRADFSRLSAMRTAYKKNSYAASLHTTAVSVFPFVPSRFAAVENSSHGELCRGGRGARRGVHRSHRRFAIRCEDAGGRLRARSGSSPAEVSGPGFRQTWSAPLKAWPNKTTGAPYERYPCRSRTPNPTTRCLVQAHKGS